MNTPAALPRSAARLVPLLAIISVVPGCDEEPTPADLDPPGEVALSTTSEVAPGTGSLVFDGSVTGEAAVLVGSGGRGAPPEAVRPGLALLNPLLDPAFQPPLGTPRPPEVSDDCQALANLGEVESFLRQADQFANGAVGAVGRCATEVEALVEAINELVANALEDGHIDESTFPPPQTGLPTVEFISCFFMVDQDGVIRFGEGGEGSEWGEIDGDAGGAGCTDCADNLAELATGLENLSRYAAQCRVTRAELEAKRKQVLREVKTHGISLTSLCWAHPSATSSVDLDKHVLATWDLEGKARDVREEVRVRIDGGVCCEASLQGSCDACPDSGDPTSPRVEPGKLESAVRDAPPGPAVGRIVGTLHRAANLSDDPDFAQAAENLASLLARTPRKRMRRVVYPAPVEDTENLLAVQRSGLDGRPRVFILTGVPGELLPTPTLQDEARWFEEIDAWRNTFTQGPVERP
ncbi:MAG: hypothetical protein GWM92_11925 [Gemmatimonadetes bacterium]|nr:hypothetical protein [Gemmatimonadota bacterium]NIR78373.1 hypothetical protein [Gemmatimonadota bacterium]NIT88065.1 hypothetical protein [Gemmatimonadota bacterium]NIU31897.1 hypothetical protein [Gemmatimonadota bacterium]NIU35597.1 hypothetical protein [Gemmatimonadota bacterium]